LKREKRRKKMIIDRQGIKELIPQRDPFLFLDEVIDLEKGKSVKAGYAFLPDAEIFKGHFPGKPVVPGVLLIEAMAQAAGVLAYSTDGCTWREKGALLLRLDKAVFRKAVAPGEKLIIEVELEHRRGSATRFKGRVLSGGKLCAEGVILAAYTEPHIKPETDN